MSRFVSRRSRRQNASGVLLAAVAGAAAVALPSLAHAGTTWDGEGAADTNWTTSANWNPTSGGAAPNFAIANALTFSTNSGVGGLSLNNNVSNATISGITFSAGAPAFAINGNAITLSGNITNSSSVMQTINLAMTTTAVRTVTAGAGGVTLGGKISGTGGGITVASGIVRLSSTNDYTGVSSTGNNGIELDADGAVGSGTLSIGANSQATTLRLSAVNADRSLANNLLTSSAATGNSANIVGGSFSITFTAGKMTGPGVVNNIVAGKRLTLNDIELGSGSFTSATISGTGKTVVAGTITNVGATTNGMTIGGSGTDLTQVVFRSANSYSGPTVAANGVLRLDDANAVPGGIGATGGTSALTIGSTSGTVNAILGLGAGNFLRDVASTATVDKVTFGSNSGRAAGFAAYGADRIVNLGGASAQKTWNSGGFVQDIFILGADDADGMLDFQNPIQLGASGTTTRTVNVRNGSAVVDGRLSGTLVGVVGITLTKTGAGTLELTATNNNYAGVTSVTAGTLRFAKQGSLYSNTPASWTKTNIKVSSAATVAFNVGGTDEFTTGNVTTLLTNLTTTINNNGLMAGSSIGFDTTNAAGNNFTVADNIVNSTGTGSGAVGVVKLGTNTLTLTGASSSYTGPTLVSAGRLLVNGAVSGAGAVTVASGATLGGTGSLAGALTVSGTLAPGASVESLSSGAVSFASGSTFAYEVDSSAAPGVAGDLQKAAGDLNLTGTVTLTVADLAGSPVAFAPGTTLTLINYTGAWNNGVFTYGGTPVADEGSFTAGLNTWKIDYNATSGGTNFTGDQVAGNFVNISVVPEPSSLVGMLGAGALMAIRRRRKN